MRTRCFSWAAAAHFTGRRCFIVQFIVLSLSILIVPVSEAEIKEGILNSSCDTSKYGWFRRQFTDLNLTSQAESSDILKYIDRTEEDENGVNIAQLQDNLKSELTKAVNAQNISVYSLKWTKNGK